MQDSPIMQKPGLNYFDAFHYVQQYVDNMSMLLMAEDVNRGYPGSSSYT